MERILDRTQLIQSYPLLELRLVPEPLSERVYGYFVAYSTDSIHNGLEPFYEVAERFILTLGNAPEIYIGGFSIFEHRVLLEKFRGELAETFDGILPQAREPLKCYSSEVSKKRRHSLASLSFSLTWLSPSRSGESVGVTLDRLYRRKVLP